MWLLHVILGTCCSSDFGRGDLSLSQNLHWDGGCRGWGETASKTRCPQPPLVSDHTGLLHGRALYGTTVILQRWVHSSMSPGGSVDNLTLHKHGHASWSIEMLSPVTVLVFLPPHLLTFPALPLPTPTFSFFVSKSLVPEWVHSPGK